MANLFLLFALVIQVNSVRYSLAVTYDSGNLKNATKRIELPFTNKSN